MRHPLLCLLGLVCVMALAFATSDANALTPLGKKADQASLAIHIAPIAVPADNVGTQNQVALFARGAPSALVASTATQSFDNQKTQSTALGNDKAVTTSPRSMPLKIETAAAMNTLRSPAKIDVNPVATARAASIAKMATLAAGFPNDFNAVAMATTDQGETTAPTSESGNLGGFNEMPGLVGAVVGDYTTSGGQYLQAA